MIYFAQALGTDRVKIGYTGGDPAKRISDLQTACPEVLELLAVINGSEQDEARWHKRFDDLRIRENGEWFVLAPRLQIAIAVEIIFDRLRLVSKSARQMPSHQIQSGKKNESSLFDDVSHYQDGVYKLPDWWSDFVEVIGMRWPIISSQLRKAIGGKIDPRIRGASIAEEDKWVLGDHCRISLLVPDVLTATHIHDNPIIAAELNEYLADRLKLEDLPGISIKAWIIDNNQPCGFRAFLDCSKGL